MITPCGVSISELDKVFEAAFLFRLSEAGYARDYGAVSPFNEQETRLRLDAFMLGVLDALAIPLSLKADSLPLLAYLKSLLEHGPGVRARDAAAEMLALRERLELRRYVACGRRVALKMLSGKKTHPGTFAELLEEECQQPS